MSLQNNKLTDGSISKALVRLALPIMGTSFVQMAYNMTDMIWIGRVGSKAVAAVGTAGFYVWLAMAFIFIPKIGAEVGVSQSIGKKDMSSAKSFVVHNIQLVILLGVLYSSMLIIFRNYLIGFFNLGDTNVFDMSVTYLVIISSGLIFFFVNPVFTAIYNGYGNSKTPFLINTVGLIINMILDPILILGIGPFKSMGVKGAALATIMSQFIVTLIFIYSVRGKMFLFLDFNIFEKPNLDRVKRIVRLGFPAGLQSGLFTIIAIIIGRIIAQWGPIPIAVQKVGSQIEAISWMTASGFSTALGTFVGQNYGAHKWYRIRKGYFVAILMVGSIGIIATLLLIFVPKPIFSIFIPEEESIRYGVVYLKILGISQLFMCLEITTAGAFNGLGKTVPPAFIGILFNVLRVPAALILSADHLLGLNGVWWSISISSVFKGTVLLIWFVVVLKRYRESVKMQDTNI